MFQLLKRVRRVRAGRDEGVALVMVLGAGMVMTLLVVAVSGYALSGYVSAKTDSDWSASVAAAQAGVDDYVARLNESDGGDYWLKGTDTANPAFASWVPVPGATNGAAFKYRMVSAVDQTKKDGLIRIESGGRVDGEVRTVAATLKRGQFSDFVYFSDLETQDPRTPKVYTDSYWWGKDPEVVCSQKNWVRDKNCPVISWATSDVVDGRFHTNDQFFVAGSPSFLGPVSSGCPVRLPNYACKSGKVWVAATGLTAAPKFAVTPVGDTQYPLPPDGHELRVAAVEDGCLFRGPTRVLLRADGTMAVHSPNTSSNPCIAGLARDSGGAYLNARQPNNGVLYVEKLPDNVTPAVSTKPYVSLPTTLNPPNSGGRNSRGRSGFPIYDANAGYDATTGYSPRNADVFIEGTLKGKLTVAAANDIIVTGNLLYKDGTTGTDILGLIADNNVSVYQPIGFLGEQLLGDDQMVDVQIHAAILAVNHSFTVQNYFCCGKQGKLIVRGSIAQKWRGAVGTVGSGNTINNGYVKAWTYDKRLSYLTPPRFLRPVESSWLQGELAEVATPAALR